MPSKKLAVVHSNKLKKFQLANIPLPENLAKTTVTPKALSKGTYQKKLASHFAPHLLPTLFRALATRIQDGDMQAISKACELYELVVRNSAVSIINNNNVDNRSVSIEASGQGRSFEKVMRLLAEEREKRALQPGPTLTLTAADFAPTPEGVSE